MRYLSRCIYLSLAVNAPLHANELTISPTLKFGLYEAKTSGLDLGSDFEEIDSVVHAELDTLIEYKTNLYMTSLNHIVTGYKYNKNDNYDLASNEFTWVNKLELLNKQLVLGHKWHRYNELFDQLNGSFKDDLYSLKDTVERDENQVTAVYTTPISHDVDGEFSFLWKEDRISNDSSPTQNNAFSATQSLRTTEAGWRLNNSRAGSGVFWHTQGDRSRQERSQGTAFIEDNAYVVSRLPLYSGLNLTLKGNYSGYSNSTSWEFGDDNGNKVETIVAGVGLSWVKEQNVSYVEFTYDRVDDSDDGKSYSLGVDFKWKFGERWNLSGSRETKFYGDSDTLSFSYIGKESALSLSIREDVSLRYITVPTTVNNGVYICEQPGEEDDFVFTQSECFIPTETNYILQPGQLAFPNSQQFFPLEPRLTKNKNYGATWVFEKSSWRHTLSFSKISDEDLTSSIETEGYESSFDGTYRLDSTNYLKTSVQYRDSEIKSFDFKTKGTVYSLGYHKELNTRAEWSFTIRHSEDEGGYGHQRDSRVMLNYTHHFGKKNTRLRSI